MDNSKRYCGAIATAILTSVSVGLYINNITGSRPNTLIGSGMIFFFSVVIIFLYFGLESKKKSFIMRGLGYMVSLVDLCLFLISFLYIVSFEYILIKCSEQAPFNILFHMIIALLLVIIFIFILISDLKKIKR